MTKGGRRGVNWDCPVPSRTMTRFEASGAVRIPPFAPPLTGRGWGEGTSEIRNSRRRERASPSPGFFAAGVYKNPTPFSPAAKQRGEVNKKRRNVVTHHLTLPAAGVDSDDLDLVACLFSLAFLATTGSRQARP